MPAVPRRILQQPQAHELERTESRRVRIRNGRTVAHSGSGYIHSHDVTPNPVRVEVVTVQVARSAGTLTHE
jgi:hypothetical protein